MRNELQEAVAHLEAMAQNAIGAAADADMPEQQKTALWAEYKALDTALTALRDMMRRREGCAMCRGIVRAEKIDMILAYKADGGIAGLSEISCNYCPRCGRKLEDEK